MLSVILAIALMLLLVLGVLGSVVLQGRRPGWGQPPRAALPLEVLVPCTAALAGTVFLFAQGYAMLGGIVGAQAARWGFYIFNIGMPVLACAVCAGYYIKAGPCCATCWRAGFAW